MKEIKSNVIAVGLFAGLGFGFFFGIFMGGFSVGLPAGIFFGLAMAMFLKFQYAKNKSLPEDIISEGILAHGPANHFLGMEGRGGWLFLTKSNLIFKPHGVNVQKAIFKIPLSDISSWGEHNHLGIIPNGIKVQKTNNVIERFVVASRNDWLEVLASSIQKKPLPKSDQMSDTNSLTAELKTLEQMKTSGTLTEDEFQKAKAKLLAG